MAEVRTNFDKKLNSAGSALRNLVCASVPWPDNTRAFPCFFPGAALPPRDAGLPGLRLSFALSCLPCAEARALFRWLAGAAERVAIADFILPERNLALPAHLAARAGHAFARLFCSGRGNAAYWKNGALEGMAHALGLNVLWRGHFWLESCAILICCQGRQESNIASSFRLGGP